MRRVKVLSVCLPCIVKHRPCAYLYRWRAGAKYVPSNVPVNARLPVSASGHTLSLFTLITSFQGKIHKS